VSPRSRLLIVTSHWWGRFLRRWAILFGMMMAAAKPHHGSVLPGAGPALDAAHMVGHSARQGLEGRQGSSAAETKPLLSAPERPRFHRSRRKIAEKPPAPTRIAFCAGLSTLGNPFLLPVAGRSTIPAFQQ